MKKILRRRCVSHETVLNKTTQIGKAASDEFEGNTVKELEGDKKLQGEYFDDMEVWEKIVEQIYMDLDGVMINSILVVGDPTMEGKVAVVRSDRELIREDTYSLVDKRLFGSFCDSERLYWDIVAELYKRSGGKLGAVEALVRGDGAPFIHGFHSKYALLCRYILDYYHLCRKGADAVLSIRILVSNGEWDDFWAKYKAA
jgi:hypothetical protein